MGTGSITWPRICENFSSIVCSENKCRKRDADGRYESATLKPRHVQDVWRVLWMMSCSVFDVIGNTLMQRSDSLFV